MASGIGLNRPVSQWLAMAALMSMAGYAHERPGDPFPELIETAGNVAARFDGEGLAHPLLPSDRAVPNDVRLDASTRVLVVSGSKERKQTRGEGENRRSERVYGSFRRSFRLPDDALRENIEARFSDGVLTVSIPRDAARQRESTRRIEVQRGAPKAEAQEEQQQSPAAKEDPQRPSATH